MGAALRCGSLSFSSEIAAWAELLGEAHPKGFDGRGHRICGYTRSASRPRSRDGGRIQPPQVLDPNCLKIK